MCLIAGTGWVVGPALTGQVGSRADLERSAGNEFDAVLSFVG